MQINALFIKYDAFYEYVYHLLRHICVRLKY